ncbi:MAG: hypothetical protein ACQERD_04600 [Campylobacterota bacterium]
MQEKIQKEYIYKIEDECSLNEIVTVYKKHGYSLSHEDTQGAFKIQGLKDENIE